MLLPFPDTQDKLSISSQQGWLVGGVATTGGKLIQKVRTCHCSHLNMSMIKQVLIIEYLVFSNKYIPEKCFKNTCLKHTAKQI